MSDADRGEGLMSADSCPCCAEAREFTEPRRDTIHHLHQEVARLRNALRAIAGCEKRVDGDVVDIARKALARDWP
jgi:hypothetical protein